ncbi:MAG TPA: hypothetical protein VIY28_13100 [Pseudonocardiaceae bacterium]
MNIAWGDLGVVFLVSFGAAVGVIVLFTVGVTVLSPAQDASGGLHEVHLGVRRAVAGLCFLACALAVLYGLYLIVFKA